MLGLCVFARGCFVVLWFLVVFGGLFSFLVGFGFVCGFFLISFCLFNSGQSCTRI